MKIHSYIFSLLACLVIALPGYSQVDRNETLIRSALHGLEYEIKAAGYLKIKRERLLGNS